MQPPQDSLFTRMRTVSEISQAEELGCEIIKLFPASDAGGPSFVRAVKGPCPWVSIMPTGGVDPTEESLKSWFEAGACCVGLGSSLITKDLLQTNDYEGLAKKVRSTRELIRELRGAKSHAAAH